MITCNNVVLDRRLSDNNTRLDRRLTMVNIAQDSINTEPEEDYQRRKVLIVDDQSFNVEAIMIIMNSLFGINTESICSLAYHGKEALKKVKESTAHFNNTKCGYELILMDCNMPFLDGYGATEQIRDFLYDLGLRQPIITAVTGHTESIFVNRAIDAGMN